MRRPELYLATVFLLAATLIAAGWADHRRPDSLARPLSEIPYTLGNWHTVAEQQLTPAVQEKLRASSYLSRTYSNGDTHVDLFIAYYAMQRAGESMHSPKHCLPGAGWDISNHEEIPLAFGASTVTINKYGIQKGTEHALTLYWYQSKDRIIANEYKAKVLFAYDSIAKGQSAGSIVRIISPTDSSAIRHASDLARLVIPEMQRCLNTRQPLQ